MAATTTYQPRTDARPSSKQVYYLARLALEAAGIPWPENRAECSALIDRLRGAGADAAPVQAPEVPF